MSSTITFYDIPGSLPGGPYSPSPNTWKIRYALNFKGLQYTTVWVEYPDIKPLYEKLGISAVLTRADGSPYYTLPLIRDASTDAIISDSLPIVEYLDKTYPDTPQLFPLGPDSYTLHAAFSDAFMAKLGNLWQFTMPAMHRVLNPASQTYFDTTKSVMFGTPTLNAADPKGAKRAEEWNKVKADFEGLAKWYREGQKFVIGNKLSWADIVVGGFVLWTRTVLGAESSEWKAMSAWNGGRWAQLLKDLEPYEVVKV
ncbi:hypothetical protein BDZ89DRAFT_1082707 [Hymenopellis radicata]|nr:hypothetical protein BDZ89DRAFT_1082707 [Hymenopellis radicata]